MQVHLEMLRERSSIASNCLSCYFDYLSTFRELPPEPVQKIQPSSGYAMIGGRKGATLLVTDYFK